MAVTNPVAVGPVGAEADAIPPVLGSPEDLAETITALRQRMTGLELTAGGLGEQLGR